MSFREMGRQAGVSQTKAKEWRDWYDAGAKPKDLPSPQPTSLAGMEHYLRLADDLEFRRAGLRIAADKLENVAGELRREAETLSATESIEGRGDPTKTAKKRFPKGEGPRQGRKRRGDG